MKCKWHKISLKRNKNGYYCDKCQKDFEWQTTYNEIEKTGLVPKRINNKIERRYLLQKFGCKCWICHGTTWMGKPIPLEVDHIDGNWEKGEVSNLRLVCGNCAMQLPTYKKRNNGKGRHYRRKRYADGKSY